MMKMLSVVVIGRNEGARLERCLASIGRMVDPGCAVEVIYVDSGSTDASLAVAKAMGAKVIPLNSLTPTAAMGRNVGWREARGEIVLLLDGDTVLAPRFVVDSLGEFENTQVAVVWGHRRESHPEKSLYNRVLDLDWIYAPGITAFCGGDALFRKATLEATGGFDDTLIAGEEPELCRRIIGMGQLILHVDRAMTMHDLGITRFRQYWRRATRAGYAYAEVSERSAAEGDSFWMEEAAHNRQRVKQLAAVCTISVVGSLAWGNIWPLLIQAAGMAGLVARTARNARWKSPNMKTLVLYGIHSHLQQLPIFIGQMRFRYNQRRGRYAAIVEYK